jgi:GNAT superfamily N-acetyltransferase
VLEATIRFETRRYDDPLVQRLIEILQADFVVRYGGPDAAVVDPDEFAPPRGLFLVAFADDEPVAMGGYRRLDVSVLDVPSAEIKRMWVHPDHRRRGYARLVLTRLEEAALDDGLGALILNTGPEQPEAIELYQSSGYEAVPAFGHYASTPGALFYGRRLT